MHRNSGPAVTHTITANVANTGPRMSAAGLKVALLAATLQVLTAHAQIDPVRARGFTADGQFDFHQVDSINTFNGNVVLTVPLGSNYAVGDGGLSYSFALVNNSSIWDHQEACTISLASYGPWKYFDQTFGPNPGNPCVVESVPNPRSNAGIGWMFTLGALGAGQDFRLAYISPDGAEHSFWPSLNANDPPPPPGHPTTTQYTRDGSYLRLQIGRTPNDLTVESPDGIRRIFYCPDPTLNQTPGCLNPAVRNDRAHFKLRRIEDPHGNAITIDYADPVTGQNNIATGEYRRWTITESTAQGSPIGRVHVATFETDATAITRVRLKNLSLATSGPGPAVYTLTYADAQIYRDAQNTAFCGECQEVPFVANTGLTAVSLLATVIQPDGASWKLESYKNEPECSAAQPETCQPPQYHGGVRTYPSRPPSSELAGRVKKITLPTGGAIDYVYGVYRYVVKQCNRFAVDESPGPGPGDILHRWFSLTWGVKVRREFDPHSNQTGRWLYTNKTLWPNRVNAQGQPLPYRPCELPKTSTTLMVDPLGKVTVNYFSTYAGNLELTPSPEPNPQGWQAREYGMPYTRAFRESGGRFLSSQIYSCPTNHFNNALSDYDALERARQVVKLVPSTDMNYDWAFATGEAAGACGTAIRETYITMEHSGWYTPAEAPGDYDLCGDIARDGAPFMCAAANRREQSRKTLYYDDLQADGTPAFTLTDNALFDGLGHYRQSTSDGSFSKQNLPSGPAQADRVTRFTNYNPGGSNIPTNKPWLLNTYTDSQTTRLNSTVRTLYKFNDATGFLEARRILKSGTEQLGVADLLTLYERHPSADGSTTFIQKRYGGDGGGLPTGNSFSPGTAPVGYITRSRYQFGNRSASEYVIPRAPTPENPDPYEALLKVEDYTLSAATGQIMVSRDSAGAKTTYSYDNMNRLISMTGADLEPITYVWSTSNPVETKVTLQQNGGLYTTITYDGFGRIVKEQSRFPGSGASMNLKVTKYRPTGQVEAVSTVGAGSTPAAWTQHSLIDPSNPNVIDVFGRTRTLTLPDDKKVDLSYTGDRITHKRQQIFQAKVGSSAGVLGSVTHRELHDASGQLHVVNDGMTELTKYQRDALGNISVVSFGVQQRLMNYDPRGFMTSEVLPELGASGQGTRTFSHFDAGGNPGKIDYSNDPDRKFSQVLTYDKAERLIEVQGYVKTADGSLALRTLKTFQYNDVGECAAGEFSRGKLQVATRYNYVPHPTHTSAEMSVKVEEFYTYAGRGGALSKVTTTVQDPGRSMVFESGQTLNSLGLVEKISYPRCVTGCGLLPQQPREIIQAYDNGGLTGIAGYATLAYHANGLLKSVKHAAVPGWEEQISVPSNNMARIRSISTKKVRGPDGVVGSGDWGTGDYAYDGAGNIMRIGEDLYRYDKLSRLVSARIGTSTQSYVYDQYGNLVSEQLAAPAPAPIRQTLLPTAASSNHLILPGVLYNAIGAITSLRDPLAPAQPVVDYKYDWDALGMMRHASGPAQGKIFVYDADNERIGIYDYKSARQTWSLRGVDNQVLRDFDFGSAGWAVKEDYIRRNGALLATVSGSVTKHYALDHLGTPRLVTDAAAIKIGTRTYFPFGEEIAPDRNDGMKGERMQVTGHERDNNDTATGKQFGDLDHMHARFYGPRIGRFLSLDPLSGSSSLPQSLGRYAYVLNNPMRYTDPTGMQSEAQEPKVIGAVYVQTEDGLVMIGYSNEFERRESKPTAAEPKASFDVALSKGVPLFKVGVPLVSLEVEGSVSGDVAGVTANKDGVEGTGAISVPATLERLFDSRGEITATLQAGPVSATGKVEIPNPLAFVAQKTSESRRAIERVIRASPGTALVPEKE